MSIADKTRELREAFREQYGLEADIQVSIYSTRNPHLDKEVAKKLGTEMVEVFGDGFTSEHDKRDDSCWFLVEQPYGPVRIALFYGDEEAPHEQSN